MFRLDTFHPFRILKAQKWFNNSSAKFPFNNRGEAGTGTGTGDGNAATGTETGVGGDTNTGTGTVTTDWKSDLDADVKGHPALLKYGNKNDAIKAFVASQVLIGRDKILIPPEGSPDEDWHGKDGVYARLGRPETAEGYILAEDIKLPDNMPVDKEFVKRIGVIAHKAGILPKQFDTLVRGFMEDNINQFNTLTETASNDVKGSETKLRQEWGTAYEPKLALAKKALSVIADKDGVEFLAQGLGNDPRIIKMFAKVGDMLGEDQLTGKPKGLTETPDEAKIKIKEMEADLKGPLFTANHPQHKEYVARRDDLYKMAYPPELDEK